MQQNRKNAKWDELFCKALYLGDVFSRLNDLNLELQGLSTTIFNVQDKIEALIKKLSTREPQQESLIEIATSGSVKI
jgi:hypothetical protein